MAAVRIPARRLPALPTWSVDNLGERLCRAFLRLVRHEARKLLLPLAALTAVSSVGTLAAPGLTGRPLLLVALSPRLSFLALAAPKVGLVPFLIVAGIRLCLADPFHFVLGRRHGAGALDRLPRWPWLQRLQVFATRSVPLLVFLRPNGTNLAIAGASRGRAVHIAMADIVGTVVYLVVVHQLGRSFLPG